MPFATVNNHSLHYTDIAPANDAKPKQTLIFIHGLGSTQNYYFPIFSHLTQYRCIIFDNYNAGRSQSDGKDTTVPSIAQDVLGLLGHLNVPSAIVVGYSMGGMLPTYLASTSPSRVTAAICIGPVHPSPQVAEVFKNRISVVQSQGMEAMANTIPNAATGPNTTALQKAFIREMLLAQKPEGYIANCKAIQFSEPPEYAKVKCPIMIIAGDVDKSAPLSGCQHIFNSLGTDASKKRLEVLEGIGHWHCVEAGDNVGGLVQEFCDGL